ncbi:hypothetical protein [uncultured Deefgea sp.]|uniref:ApeP family dehydratase n=1 Tax=uncultured Deefgea sp. TaxID=1304914 RepID=UPI00261637AD|nr:hypothetical protein [uncultured Deefgea sp.]
MNHPHYLPHEVLPHAAPMILLDRIIQFDAHSLTAALTVPADSLFNDPILGGVPAYVAIEYMAQAIAALDGCHARRSGQAPKIGFLLGTRHFASNVPCFKPGTQLTICVNEVIKGDNGMAVFAASVNGVTTDGQVIAVNARINGFQPENPSDFLSN